MRTCSRKRIIVYRKYVMFIKQSPTRFTMVTKNDTKTGHFLIYICQISCYIVISDAVRVLGSTCIMTSLYSYCFMLCVK